MNKMFFVGAVLLTLVGCDKPTAPAPQAAAKPVPVEIPQQDGQYLRFIQMPDGETRLEAARNIGKVTKVISGYPGFSVATNVFPDVSPLVVRIKDCGLISFTNVQGNANAMTAVRTETQDFNAQCPIQKVDGLWIKLSAQG
ncbi:hypothetical protein PSH87_28535 [Pseudomonas sp. FP453]|jgi:hypothetical protein|uniref:hypothetical protein n=1 Tax=unclassified Pseudomonas TaxID=196821 RepID=UPI000347F355|nr:MULTISPECIES: hypothetical protein [unclassified Pseudomonas]WLH90422.1 hypothetical protein PSH87_28535 [Pseudomonas sp. FP453]